jgi:hypothetical protein
MLRRMSPDEHEALQRWLAAYEPAADIVVSANEVVARSTRHPSSARVRRTNDLASDLRHVVADLVDSMS